MVKVTTVLSRSTRRRSSISFQRPAGSIRSLGVISLLLALACAGCSGLGKKESTSLYASQDVASEGSGDTTGSHFVMLYNNGHRALQAGDEAVGAEDLEKADSEYRDAKRSIAAARSFMNEKQESGEWNDSLKYRTDFDKGELSEKKMLSKLDALAENAEEKLETIKPKMLALWATKYRATSDEALEVLETHGPPKQVKQERKRTCWYFDVDDDTEMYCWTKKGALAEHKVTKLPKSVTNARVASRLQCAFGNCFTEGWTAESPDGPHEVSCIEDDCLAEGWTTSHPDGSVSTTRCSNKNCKRSGWSVSSSGGNTITCRCTSGDCTEDFSCE
jgi:hypothetical protein